MSADMGTAYRDFHHARGVERVEVGDVFRWHDGRTWRVESFTGDRIYSPSGFGGTSCVMCRQIAGERDLHAHQWATADDLVEWCGDSVAAGLSYGRIAHLSSGITQGRTSHDR